MKTLIVHSHPQSISSLDATIDAATMLSQPIDAIIIGPHANIDTLAIDTIWHYPDLTHPSAKTIASIVKEHNQGYSHILCHSDTTGKDYLPYFCGQNDLPMINDIIKIIDSKTFERFIYAGAAIEHIQTQEPTKVLSIRGIYFTKKHTGTPTINTQTDTPTVYEPTLIEAPQNTSDLPDLKTADIVISGGRGFGSKESFAQIYELAKHYNAAVGASRAAVDAGYIGNDHQVGQTGKQIAPSVYFALGISGAVQHLSGMKDSQTIVAVDKDPDAPIFKIAQYGYVGDLFEVIPRLMKHTPKN